MASEDISKMLENKEKLINKACYEAMKAHEATNKLFLEKSSDSEAEVVFSFPGTWSVKDWYSEGPFGSTKINLELFPSLRSIGNDETAKVNEAFQKRFQSILEKQEFQKKVEKAVEAKKQIVFTGHSSGGPIAALATIWFLEEYLMKRRDQTPLLPLCLTFGSPLVGNHIFSHALRRENWARCFFHFVARHDIVPRVFLAPLSSIQQQFPQVLELFGKQTRPSSLREANDSIASQFFTDVITNALTLTSHVACKLMESGNPLLETMASFIELSPYRPFGNYIFFEGNEKLVALDNSEAVLQLLFYSCQPSNDEEAWRIAKRSLEDHFAYQCKPKKNVSWQISSEKLLDSLDRAAEEFELSPRGRLCLLAAGESEEQKKRNQEKVDSKKEVIERALRDVENYRRTRELNKVLYFDSFKLQKIQEDFNANVKRLELTGIWDEIIEMLKSYKLPDQFEVQREWIEIGTRFRRLLEPLDIANYYRHLKNDETGPYMDKARPKRYRYTQRWLEHANKMERGSHGESCFWAEVEELRAGNGGAKFGERALKVQRNLLQWKKDKVIEDDVFLSDSTFVKWWKSLAFPTKVLEIQHHVQE